MNDSPFQADFVELIVREVIRRLQANGVTVAMSNGTPTNRSANVQADAIAAAISSNTAELGLTERLVTLETLRDRLQGVKRLTVEKKAIITPAVRDELKRKKIELIRK